jgi:glycerol-3-phosphate acyltransferase PlsY
VDIYVCLLTAVAAYFLGSIPTGYLVGKARGIDVRTVGSGNIGATNAFRVLGKGPGIVVLAVDALKGFLAVAVAPGLIYRLFFSTPWTIETHDYLRIIAAIVAILGHNYTCWLKFKGGKGIATTAGVLAALVPVTFVAGVGAFIVVAFITRYVSVASLAAAVSLPVSTWLAGYGQRMIIVTAVMSVLAFYKHKANISRLMNGTENRIGQRKNPPATGPMPS